MICSPLSPAPPRHRRRPCHRSDSRRARRVPAGRGAATAPPGDDCAAWVRCEGVTRIRVRSNAPKSPPGGAVAPTPTLQPPGPSPAAQRRGRESRQGVRRHIRREARAAAALRRVPASVCFLLSLRQSSRRDRPGRARHSARPGRRHSGWPHSESGVIEIFNSDNDIISPTSRVGPGPNRFRVDYQ